jgi:hypothetical protein
MKGDVQIYDSTWKKDALASEAGHFVTLKLKFPVQ